VRSTIIQSRDEMVFGLCALGEFAPAANAGADPSPAAVRAETAARRLAPAIYRARQGSLPLDTTTRRRRGLGPYRWRTTHSVSGIAHVSGLHPRRSDHMFLDALYQNNALGSHSKRPYASDHPLFRPPPWPMARFHVISLARRLSVSWPRQRLPASAAFNAGKPMSAEPSCGDTIYAWFEVAGGRRRCPAAHERGALRVRTIRRPRLSPCADWPARARTSQYHPP